MECPDSYFFRDLYIFFFFSDRKMESIYYDINNVLVLRVAIFYREVFEETRISIG